MQLNTIVIAWCIISLISNDVAGMNIIICKELSGFVHSWGLYITLRNNLPFIMSKLYVLLNSRIGYGYMHVFMYILYVYVRL